MFVVKKVWLKYIVFCLLQSYRRYLKDIVELELLHMLGRKLSNDRRTPGILAEALSLVFTELR